ncbi:hypothetical protein LUZ63_020181 [Rhynchospora breviuscula]|uniref:MFS transporter n=1 Tax=Rhynchospora breviuscula TaxID=2022672 RepID=A0A9P9ZA04_9POAL|nr:hypothetical protein LUZ63_020181 [Rhynchospora breviuscula]
MARQWVGVRGLSQAGDAVWTVALAWTAVHVASPAAAGAVVAAGTVPRALLMLVGGVVADRCDPRRVMRLASAARIVVLVGVAVRVDLGPPSLTVLLVAAVAFGVSDAAYLPSASTISRQLVRREDLPAYAGMGQTAHRLGDMLGAAGGGLVVAAWGIGASAAIDAVTFAVVLAFLAWRLVPRHPLPRAEPEHPLRSVAGALAHLRAEPLTRTLVVAMSGLNLFVVPAETVGLALRARGEGWGAGSVGVFLALTGLGAAAGSVVLIRRRPRHEARAAFAWLVVQGIAIVAMGLGPWWLTACATFAVGITAGVASVLLGSVFQAVVAGAYLGRMSSLQLLGDDLLMPLATAGFGALAAAAQPGAAFTAYGAAMVLAVCVPLSKRRVRALRLVEG